ASPGGEEDSSAPLSMSGRWRRNAPASSNGVTPSLGRIGVENSSAKIRLIEVMPSSCGPEGASLPRGHAKLKNPPKRCPSPISPQIMLDSRYPGQKILMARYPQLKTDISALFFKPLDDIYSESEHRYDCQSISDLHFAALGVLRCLSHAKTGHEFLQHHADQGVAHIEVSHFFKALKSPRRGRNLGSINSRLRPLMAARLADPFAEFEELKGFD